MPKQSNPNGFDLKPRAYWLAWRYDLDEKEVLQALLRTDHRRDEEISSEMFEYAIFEPSLEEALSFLRPKVALKLFLNGDMKAIKEWLDTTRHLLGPYGEHRPFIEEQCRWDAESYFMNG